MLVLSLDTTTRVGSCAVLGDEGVILEMASDPSQPPASRLPRELMILLERAHVALGDVDVFAVATGPGSFTGLRIGIATMQGLAFAERKPLIGISGLDALARITSRSVVRREAGARIATWVDAWRGEVYAALYDGEQQIAPPTVATPAALLPALAGTSTTFIGDGANSYRDAIREALGDDASIADPATPLLAATIAVMAADAARAGHRPPPDAIRPLYVRRPDAELARDARAAG